MIKINGKDISTWGAVLQIGALEQLLGRGEPKAFTENEFRSIDGKQVLPKDPREHARTLSLDFSVKGVSRVDFLSKYASFITELASGLISLSVGELNMTFRLIYKRVQPYITEYDPTFGVFKITFEEINPKNRGND